MIDEIRPGVLTKEQIINLKGEVIDNLNGDIDLSAFDLRLSEQGWEMKGSIKGSSEQNISQITGKYGEVFDLKTPKTLKRKKTYIFQLIEGLNLSGGKRLFGRATGKSSIGRLDILTRLMVDKSPSYDEIEDGYSGSLYLEVTPITFDVKVKRGLALSQLRLFRGRPEDCELKDEVLKLYGGMILKEDGSVKKEKICELRVNLEPDPKKRISFYRAKEITDLEIDLTVGKEKLEPEQFWDGKKLEGGKNLEIKPEKFYILRSKERFRLPLDVAVSCQAISETLGELRIHYAGFVHPDFGMGNNEGTPIIFEVRGHNVDIFLRDGEVLARIKFYRMSERCKKPSKNQKSGYENQELNLSNYFKEWQR